jgi:alkylated DNA repair dioxygenase AlkB
MKPVYIPNIFNDISFDEIMNTTPWIRVTDARLECFMSHSKETYTYGSGNGIRTYTPVPYSDRVQQIEDELNKDSPSWVDVTSYNVCFLNRYDGKENQLGWHSDDSPGMDHDHPIAVISFGQAREIWWRTIGQTGIIPHNQRQLLEHGSVFIMPPGMQRTHQHRIPKGDRVMLPRISLTYRHYIPV